MGHEPSQPFGAPGVAQAWWSSPMTKTETASWADLLEVLMTASTGVFPGPVLERLIARMEEQA
jgi:hypothetical protein